MIAKYNNKSLAYGLPGILLQFGGKFLKESTSDPAMNVASSIIILLGFVLLLIGMIYYTKGKGRNPAWCLLAFLSIIGLIILACIKDKTRKRICPQCTDEVYDISFETGPN